MDRLCINWLGGVAFATCALLPLAVLAGNSRPNVVVLVGDDMGYADIGVHGCKDIPTPNIDALAQNGVRCADGYVSGTYCSPTRAGLLTGRYQTRFGHEFNPRSQPRNEKPSDESKRADDLSTGLPLDETTMADRFKRAGYRTALIGKWHLGSEEPYRPLRRGFDEFFGFLAGSHSYWPDRGQPIYRDNEVVEETEYFTDLISREAVAFIDRQSDKPFFLCVTYNAVHTPMEADSDRLKKFSQIKNEKRRTYAAMMSAMDDSIGAIMEKLHEKKLDENTIVFFISDNGGPTMPTTTQNASINAPFRGSKRTTLEGGIHVPFIVQWAGHLPAGKVYNQPVIQLDILPTALAAAKIDIPDDDLEGVDLLPFFKGEDAGAPHDALFWRFGDQMAVRQGDWKLVKYDVMADGDRARGGQVSEAKLYNVASDPGETKNLIREEPAKATSLQTQWNKWNESNVPPLWRPKGKRKAQKARAGQQQAARDSA